MANSLGNPDTSFPMIFFFFKLGVCYWKFLLKFTVFFTFSAGEALQVHPVRCNGSDRSLSKEKWSKVRCIKTKRSSLLCPKHWCNEFVGTFYLGVLACTTFPGAPLEPIWTIGLVPPAQGTAAATSGLHFTCVFLNELLLLLWQCFCSLLIREE